MDGKKEYVIKINGVSEGVTDVTKLEDAVNSLDGAIKKVNDTSVSSAKTSSARKTALSEEEKAAQKLAETQKKIEAVNSEVNRTQIAATQALRERTREVTRQIQVESLAEGSIRRIGMELHDMREAYKLASPAQREYLDSIDEGREKIQALDEEYKSLKESVGQYQDSVGNYGKALQGLDKLSTGIDGVTKTSQGLAQSLIGGIALMSLFGSESEEDAERTKQLQKVIALLSIAQQVNNNILKQGIVQGKAAAILDTVRTTQLRAKTAAETASTKGTIAATVAQKIFNVVASANPYVLLALALVTVGAALFAFTSKTENAAKAQQKLNDAQNAYLDDLDEETHRVKAASETRVADMERELRVLRSQNVGQKDVAKHLSEIHTLENKIAAERKTTNAYLRGYRADEVRDLDANKAKLKEYEALLKDVNSLKRDGKKEIMLGIELDGNMKRTKIDDAVNLVQGRIDGYNKKIGIGVELKTDQKEGDTSAEEQKNRQEKEQKELTKSAAEAAKKRAETELGAIRAAEDSKLKLIQNTDEQSQKILEKSYARQIEDIRKRLAIEKDLTPAARAALNDQIKSLEEQKVIDLERLQKEQAARALALTQEVEDSRLALLTGAYDRQRDEIKMQCDRQIEAYQKRLQEDKTLTESQQAEITELIVNAQKVRGQALAKLTADQAAERADLELSAVEDALTAAQNKIGEMVVRDKSNRWELIDVDATRKNLAAANSALDEYVLGSQDYLTTLRKSHEKTLATLKEGTPEYEAEQQQYARTVESVTKRIKDAQKEQADNTTASAKVQGEATQELFGKISDTAAQAADAIGQAMGMVNAGLSEQIDALNAQIDAVNEKYETAQKQREDAAANVEDIEKRLQEASGGTAEALKEQLQEAMHARNEAAREEQRLAKEKERLEAQVAKKEKQIKRNDLISNIAVGVANTAQAVTAMLTAGPIVGQVLAGIAASIGAVQVGIMTRQLAKLEYGGEIKGPSHANGGVPIKVNGQYAYEAQGGEFMVNDKAYSANKPLVNFLNSAKRTITASDLTGVVPDDTTPAGVTDVARLGEDRIVDALNSINFQPTVAVTDIQDVSNEVVAVRDLAGV